MFWWARLSQRNAWNDFQVNINFLGWFLAYILSESFIKSPFDPYYEPLSWFILLYIYKLYIVIPQYEHNILFRLLIMTAMFTTC